MNTDDLDSQQAQDVRSHERMQWGLIVFLALGMCAILTPHATVWVAGVYWGAVLAGVVLIVWVMVMQTSCMNGGLICSLVAMIILSNSLGIVLAAVVRYLVSTFS